MKYILIIASWVFAGAVFVNAAPVPSPNDGLDSAATDKIKTRQEDAEIAIRAPDAIAQREAVEIEYDEYE
jgi:hypothetical protein